MHHRSRSVYWILFASLFLGLSCYTDQPVEALVHRFRTYSVDAFPGEGSPLLPLSSLRARLDSIAHYRALLMSVDTHYLSAKGKDQRQWLQVQLDNEWDRWEPYRTNPSLYNLGGLLKQELLNTGGKRREIRLQGLMDMMDRSDAYYEAARQNLLIEEVSLYRLAAQKQYLGLEFLENELQDSLVPLNLSPSEQAQIQAKIKETNRALKDYLAFCESIFLNHRDSTYYEVSGKYQGKESAGQ